MAEPTLALTFEDYLIRVAEYLGVAVYTGTAAAALPTNPHDLDLCKRIVNDGWRSFYNANPKWNWAAPTFSITFEEGYTGTAEATSTSTTIVDADVLDETDNTFLNYLVGITEGTGIDEWGTVTASNEAATNITFSGGLSGSSTPDATSVYRLATTACVQGDDRRYYLPEGFYGQLVEWFTYEPDGPNVEIIETSYQQVRELHASSSSQGYPTHFAIAPVGGALGTTYARRWELFVWPRPASSYIVRARCRIYPNELSATTDTPNCGFQFDEAVMGFVMAQAERQQNDMMGPHTQALPMVVGEAIRMDQAAAPKRILGSQRASYRVYTGVDAYVSANGTTYSF